MKRLFTLLLCIGLFSTLSFGQNVGEVAPDFTLKDLNDQEYTLSANKGKVILVFLVGYNCTLCLNSAPKVKSALVDEFSDKSNFQVLVIDVWDGSKTGVQSFKSATGINATYLQEGSKVASGWSSTKDRLFVIDTEGKIAFKGTRAAQSDTDAAKTAIQSALNNVTTSVDISEADQDFVLGQNYPNPAVEKTTIQFSVKKPTAVRLSVYDNSGRMVLVPVDQYYNPGKYEVSIERDQLKKGIYFYRFETEEFSDVKKLVFQ